MNWYIKYPKGKLQQDYYLRPFEKDLWLAIFLTLTSGTALILASNIKSKKKSLVDNIFLVFEILCNQSGNQDTDTFMKIILLAMSITGIIIVNSFNSVITAFLAVEIPQIPFTNLDQFLQNGQYHLAIPHSFTFFYFEVRDIILLRNLYSSVAFRTEK